VEKVDLGKGYQNRKTEKIGSNRAFFRDIWKENAVHSLYFKAFFRIMVA